MKPHAFSRFAFLATLVGSLVLPLSAHAASATLIVIKHVVNDNGGTGSAGDFSINVSGFNVSPSSFTGQEDPGTTVSLDADEYVVSETPVAGYDVTYSTDCSGVLSPDQTKTCTITNDDQAPTTGTITVNKVVVNDNGGTVVAGDVPLFIDGSAVTNGVASTQSAGSYVVSETNPTGYTAVFSGDCDVSGNVTLAAGENKVCTITNDDLPGTLHIVKTVINNNGGSLTAGNFNMLVTATDASQTSFQGSEAGVDVTVDAGAYSVSESTIKWGDEVTHGYNMTSSVDCTGSIANGETKTCTITNDDPGPAQPQTGTLIVVKNVVNDNGLTLTASNFTITVTYGGDSFQTFSGSSEGTTIQIDPGAYTVTEASNSQYTTTMGEGCSGSIEMGQTITCTVTNNDIALPTPPSGGHGSTPPPPPNLPATGFASPSLSTPPTPRVLGVEDIDPSVCRSDDPETQFISADVEAILAALNAPRDTDLEGNVDRNLVPKVLPNGVTLTERNIVKYFTAYGTRTIRRLGAGERAGVVNSFRAVYGHLPTSDCDWMNALRIAKGQLPITRAPEREKKLETTFKTIYKREPVRTVDADNATVLIMSYGLRPTVRSLEAERQAIRIFRSIFGHTPRNVNEWDIMRGIAYGGVTVPGFDPIVR